MHNSAIATICTLLELGVPLAQPTPVHGGLLHRMWYLHTTKGIYAVKQLSKDIALTEQVRHNYELSEHIADIFKQMGIPAISALTHTGKHIVDSDNDAFLVYPWVKATTLAHNAISAPHALKIARLLAQMHSANLHIADLAESHYTTYTASDITTLIHNAEDKSLVCTGLLKQHEELMLEINATDQSYIPLLQKTSCVSHGDLDQKNVLWDEAENPIIIDWESAHKLNPTQEIIGVALDWSGITTNNFDERILLQMIAAYVDAGGTIKQDALQAAFFGILGGWMHWMLFNVQRAITSTSTDTTDTTKYIDQVYQTMQTIVRIKDLMPTLIAAIMRENSHKRGKGAST